MKINKLNYEAYAVDYLEGNLSSGDRQVFEKLLKQYPEIKKELSDYLEAPLMQDSGSQVFVKKEEVKQKAGLGRSLWVFIFLMSLASILTVVLLQKVSTPTESSRPVETKSNTEQQRADAEENIVTPAPMMASENIEAQDELEEVIEKDIRKGKENVTSIKIVSKPSLQKSLALEKTKQFESLANEIVEAGEIAQQIVLSQEIIAVTQSEVSGDDEAQVTLQEVFESAAGLVLDSVSIDKIAVLVAENISSSERQAPILEADFSRAEVVVAADTKSKKKKSKWLKILTPQAYDKLNLRAAMATSSLQSAASEIEKAVVPQSLNTK